ncbi:MAG TPA: hydantoinase B/oxoprolinase family protein [Nitrolancea sp.]
MTEGGIDPITFELIRNALTSIVDDMALTIVRTAYSNVVRDNMDFSTALCDRSGNLIAQGLTIPLHLGSVPDAMAAFFRAFGDDIVPGDVWIMNDPFSGGMHLPDIFVVKPIFTEDATLCGFAVTIAHHTDVGGRVAGGNASDSTEIYQEGVRIPPLRLYRRGEPNETFFTLFLANVRVPDKVLGDLRAQLAACHIAERRLRELIERFGVATLDQTFAELLDYAERMVRAEIARMPDGVYRFTDYIDNDGIAPGPIAIAVTLTIAGDKIDVDFAGSAPQVKGAINSTLSVTKSMAYAAIRCVLPPEIPNNAGIFRAISVSAPPGTVVHAVPPAAVAARGLTAFRMGDALIGALAQALPERVFAAGEGGNSGISIGGYDAKRRPFIYVEFVCGCWGARAGKDGVDGITNVFSDLSNNPVEMIEASFPLRIDAYELVPNSGGAGRFRGGMGIRKQITFLEKEAVLQVRSDRMEHQPYGLDGGRPGAPTHNRLLRSGAAHPMPSKFTEWIHYGDTFDHRQAGGGGFGDPFTRDSSAVLTDVRNGLVSPASARHDYGVVIDPECWEVDKAETKRLRGR